MSKIDLLGSVFGNHVAYFAQGEDVRANTRNNVIDVRVPAKFSGEGNKDTYKLYDYSCSNGCDIAAGHTSSITD